MEPDVRKRQIMIWYIVAAVIGILLFQQFWSSYSQIETIPYSEFEHLLDQGKIAEVTVGTDTVQGSLKDPLPSDKREFFAIRVDPQLGLLAESDLKNRITVLMGGRAAESLIFAGDVSTGAADDLQRATEIALEMVTRHGMDDKIGQGTHARPPHSFLPGVPTDRIEAAEATALEIDIAVRDIIAGAFRRATDILQSRRPDLEGGVKLLLTRETLTVEDLPKIRSKVTPAQRRTTIPPQDEVTPPTSAEC